MIYRRKCSWLSVLLVSAALCCACGGQKIQEEGQEPVDSVAVCRIDTVPQQNGPDQTLYGCATDFGMSTFTLKTNDGEEYSVTRVSEKGKEGRIWGSLVPGMHYAMMLEDTGDALDMLINTDELEHFVNKNYYIYNGELILTLDSNREWVDVESLSDHEFKAIGKTGKLYSFSE